MRVLNAYRSCEDDRCMGCREDYRSDISKQEKTTEAIVARENMYQFSVLVQI